MNMCFIQHNGWGDGVYVNCLQNEKLFIIFPENISVTQMSINLKNNIIAFLNVFFRNSFGGMHSDSKLPFL